MVFKGGITTGPIQTEGIFRKLLESAPDAMVIVNHYGDICLINNQTEKLFGYTEADLLGESVEFLLPERFRHTHQANRNHFFETPKTRGMGEGLALYGARRNGEEFPVEISLSPLETDEGLLVSAAIRDITERKQVEADLARYARQLELKNEELEQFAFIASHDLQEPLRTVSNFVQLLSEEYKENLDENADQYMHFISEASQRMSQLVKGLLEYSRAGRSNKPKPVDTNRLVQTVLDDLHSAITRSKASISVDRLPSVMASEPELRQLFQNLLSNAIKFSKPEKPPRIHIGVDYVGDHCCFAIQDNGIGIEDAHQEKVFMIFQRLHSPDEYEGTGIGLAHCKKIIETFGGDIWVESQADKGSTFHFTLPKANPGLTP